MIAPDKLATLKAGGDYAEVCFGLSGDGIAIVLDILRDQLYSNKELAVIRELVSNAYDAMVEAGKSDQPFVVGLPTADEPTFRVRDFGYGLTPQEVRDIFVNYGASTKRASNAFIGQKGIGAKSPFAYTDSFLVVSRQHNRKQVYSAVIDPTMVGKMVLLSDEESEEPDGLEVIVSIREEDIDKFRKEASGFFRFWTVRPTFEGFIPTFEKENILFEGEKKDWVLPAKAESWTTLTSTVIMGNVPYTLDANSFDWSGCDSSLRVLLKAGIRIRVDIGSIEVSASREALQYTSVTQKVIIDKLAQARAELINAVNVQLTTCPSMYAAKELYHKIFDFSSNLYPLRDLFGQSLTFNGKPVTSDYWEGHNASTIGAIARKYVRASGRRSRAYSEGESYRFIARETVLYVLNDLGTDKGILSRLAALLESDENHLKKQYSYICVLSVKDSKVWDEWRTESGFDAPLVPLSTLPKVSLKEVYPSGSRNNAYFNPKHAAKVFRWEDAGSTSRHDRADHWEEMDFDYHEEEGVYVVINTFSFIDETGRECHPSELASLSKTVEAAGIEWPELVGIKIGKIGSSGYPKKMISLKTYLAQEVAKKIEATPQFNQDISNYDEVGVLHSMGYYFSTVYSGLDILATKRPDIIPSNSPIAAFLRHYQEMNVRGAAAISLSGLAQRFNIACGQVKTPPTFLLHKEWENLKALYPMLFMIDSGVFLHYWNDQNQGHVGKYISSIDAGLSTHKNVDAPVTEGEGI